MVHGQRMTSNIADRGTDEYVLEGEPEGAVGVRYINSICCNNKLL